MNNTELGDKELTSKSVDDQKEVNMNTELIKEAEDLMHKSSEPLSAHALNTILRLTDALKAQEWNPDMSKAPKDGTRIDLWVTYKC